MDIYERLEKDHDRQRELAAAIAETSGDTKDRRRLWDRLKSELEAHANAEEQTFYATLMERPETQEKSRHSVAEHKEAADLLEELEELDMASGGWLQKFKKLKEEVEHHVDEEEREVFPKARAVLSDAEATELAGDFDSRKSDELQEQHA